MQVTVKTKCPECNREVDKTKDLIISRHFKTDSRGFCKGSLQKA